MEQVIEYRSYQEYKQELDTELKKTAEGFVRIGYLLKVARDTSILAESGYDNVVDFARAEYGIDKTQVSRFIHINDKFSQGGYAPELKEEYQGFGYAKLSIMLSLPDSVNEELTPDFSKSEVQQVKDEIDEEKKTTDIEVMLEEKDSVQQSFDTNLEKAVYQLGKDAPEVYKRLWESAVKNGESGKRFIENLIPDEKAMYIVRIPGAGRCMLSMKAEEDAVKLINIRDSSANETYTKQELEDALKKMMPDTDTWGKAWESLYGEKLPAEKNAAVAPVQPKAAPRKESKVIVPKKPEPVKSVQNIPESVSKTQESVPESKETVSETAQKKEMTLNDVNPEIPAPDPKPVEEDVPEEKPDVQQDTNEQIPGQDEIENHPEYMPEKKTDQQIIEDAKRTIDTIRVSLSGWEYTIPQNTLTAVLERVDYLKETLQGLVKGEADESNV
jgi:hypothetical protein|nr:MAG TPA_asm: Protein of unknown function (DUF3102) [Caudoviricetes sp.]